VLDDHSDSAIAGEIYSIGGQPPFQQGLEIKNENNKLAYIARDGKPLLAFGAHLEHMFLRDNEPDYTVWSSWAQEHGMNHCRTRVIQPMLGDQYKPYKAMGNGKYDLTQFDLVFWKRFRAICVNLRDHGIVMHLLLFPHNGHVRTQSWPTSLFNPTNNVNEATQHLSGENHYEFWHSVADQRTPLWEIQRDTVKKIVQHTADLDNVYYDLSHEFRTDCCGAEPTDWNKAKQFFEAMAETIRTTYSQLQPEKKPLIGLDAEHFAKSGELDWNFGNPSFNLMILGVSGTSPVPSLEQIIAWREQYKKPFQIQEGWDDGDYGEKTKVGYHDATAATLRKFAWKWMMGKNQFIDIYQKEDSEGYPDNYDPYNHNSFEEDAGVLRAFWHTLKDYPSLDYAGEIASGPGFRKVVLSSSGEAIAYMASKLVDVGTEYPSQDLELKSLNLVDGEYQVVIWHPRGSAGPATKDTAIVAGGALVIRLPAFTDDLAVHLYRD
jgi:hypothetical protein